MHLSCQKYFGFIKKVLEFQNRLEDQGGVHKLRLQDLANILHPSFSKPLGFLPIVSSKSFLEIPQVDMSQEYKIV